MPLVFFLLWWNYRLLLLAANVLMFVTVPPVFWDMWNCYLHLPSSASKASSPTALLWNLPSSALSSCSTIKLVMNCQRYVDPTTHSIAVECSNLVLLVTTYRWSCHHVQDVIPLCVSGVNVCLKSTSCLILAHYTMKQRDVLLNQVSQKL